MSGLLSHAIDYAMGFHLETVCAISDWNTKFYLLLIGIPSSKLRISPRIYVLSDAVMVVSCYAAASYSVAVCIGIILWQHAVIM